MKCKKETMLLYAVTDRQWTGEQTLAQQVESALKGGATCIQLREKELDRAAFLQEAVEIGALCKRYGVPFFINDDVDIAIECGADGIHVGQSDMEAANVRALVGEGMMLGVSAQTVEQAVAAEKAGADYLGVGAVFSTSTKSDADDVSHSTLREICSAVSIPVVAIGGITKDNMKLLEGTGIDGVALVSAIFAARDIEDECKQLCSISRKIASKTVKGVIFDFDGTLFDSMYIWDTIGDIYLRSLGIEPEKRLGEKLKSYTLPMSAEYFREQYGVPYSTDEIVDTVNSMVESFYMNEAVMKEGAAKLLREMKEAGVKMCIATVTDKYLVKAALERCGADDYFSEIFTCADVGHSKREPVIYREAMKHLGTERADTLVFEDSFFAAKTAKDDGFKVIAVYDRHEEKQEEISRLADLYIKDLSDTAALWRFANSL